MNSPRKTVFQVETFITENYVRILCSLRHSSIIVSIYVDQSDMFAKHFEVINSNWIGWMDHLLERNNGKRILSNYYLF